MWTLDEALDIIRRIQPKLKEINYHVCLGGGVQNNGSSDHDLDLYFLPLEDEYAGENKDLDIFNVMKVMHEVTGKLGRDINDTNYEHTRTIFNKKIRYMYQNKQIDCFIIR